MPPKPPKMFDDGECSGVLARCWLCRNVDEGTVCFKRVGHMGALAMMLTNPEPLEKHKKQNLQPKGKIRNSIAALEVLGA